MRGYFQEAMSDSPMAYHRLGERTGAASAADASGRGHVGTYGGARTLETAGLIGDGDTAATLPGGAGSGYISIPGHADLDVGDVFTLECLFRIRPNPTLGATTRMVLFDKGADGYALTITYDTVGHPSRPRIELWKSDAAAVAATWYDLYEGVVYHVAVTKNGADIHIYVDGVDATYGPATANQTIANTALSLYLGRYRGGDQMHFDGVLDECAVYATALSAARIGVHHAARPSSRIWVRSVVNDVYIPTLRTDLSLTQQLGERDRAVVRIQDVRPTLPGTLVLYDGDKGAFGGVITATKEMSEGAAGDTFFTRIEAVGFEQAFDKILVTESYDEGTLLKTIITDLNTKYLASRGFTVDPAMANGPAISQQAWSRRPLGDIFRELAKVAAHTFRSSPVKIISWEAAGTSTAPAVITDASVVGEITVDRDLTDYANSVTVLAGDPTTPIVETALDQDEIDEHGLHGIVVEARDVWTEAAAQSVADAILTVRKVIKVKVHFTTRLRGFAVGQKVTLSSTKRGLSSADYLIQSMRTVNSDGEASYACEATSLIHMLDSYLETYRQWGGSGAATVPASVATSLSSSIWDLGGDVMIGRSSSIGARIPVYNSKPARIDSATWSGRVVVAYVRVRANTNGVAVTPYIVRDDGVVAATGAAASQDWWDVDGNPVWSAWQALAVTVAAGSGAHYYELQTLPGAVDELVHGQGAIHGY